MSDIETETKINTQSEPIDVEERFKQSLKKNQFINPSFELYGSPAGFHTHGVLGTALKRRILDVWRNIFCNMNPDDHSFTVHEIDTPIIGPEQVFITSGHVARFTDPVIKDKDGKIERLDHYLKARIRGIETDSVTRDDLLNRLDDFDSLTLEKLLEKFGEPERKFGTITKENLMLSTKTSLADQVSYLRPETAQGLITEFKNIYRYHGETLPLGISQIGRVYRKEISPKPFIRLREFEQAEIELFHDPLKPYELPDVWLNTKLNIFSAKDQESGKKYDQTQSSKTLGELTDKKNKSSTSLTSLNPLIAHFMYKITRFTESLGLNGQRLRFRQHLKNELAHYSSDCWDLEYLVRDKATNLSEIHPDENHWIEVIGIADRGGYDLTQHNNNPIVNTSMMVRRTFDPPIKRTVYDFKFDMKTFGKQYLKNAGPFKAHLLNLESTDPGTLDQIIENNQLNIPTTIVFESSDSKSKTLTLALDPGVVKISRSEKLISSEEFIPHIIEPSFGIDRLMYATLNSLFWVRPEDSERTVLSLGENIAPITVGILPLFNKETMTHHIPKIVDHIRKNKPGYVIKVDCSGASIGKRYSRLDEIGVPWVITIDHQTDEDLTVTLRSRDNMKQIRVNVSDLHLYI